MSEQIQNLISPLEPTQVHCQYVCSYLTKLDGFPQHEPLTNSGKVGPLACSVINVKSLNLSRLLT